MNAALPRLYAHPFSSYCQKALVALYEHGTRFDYRNIEDPQANAELVALWPMRRFPILVDGGRTILEASCIIEYLELHHPGPARLLPEDRDAALEVRMLDRFFDNYVSRRSRRWCSTPSATRATATRMASAKHAGCSTPRTPGSTRT